MASSISAGTTSATALVHTADTTGALQLATNNGTVAVTINTSQNVGVGTASPAYKLDVNGDANVLADSSYFIGAGADRYIKYRSANGDILYSFSAGNFYQQHITSSYHAWFTSNNERMRIDTNGRIQVNGTTVVDVARISVSFNSADSTGIGIQATNATGGTLMKYQNSGGTDVGSITTNATITAYNTTSDYRLKTVVGAVSGFGERIDALKPVEYTWNLNGSSARGFLAHQFQEVYADSVTGTKDAVDADGKPAYQGMQASSSEVIADLVAEIQSLRKRLTALEALTTRITALEGTPA